MGIIGGGEGGGGEGGGEGRKGSAAALQLKPSLSCVTPAAAPTHFSVTGVGGGFCIGD